MFKKIIKSLFILPLVFLLPTNVVSCGLKQSQLSFQIKDWKSSWILNNANIWQAMAKKTNESYLPNFPGLFLDEKDQLQSIDQVHKKISSSVPIDPGNGGLKKRKSISSAPETFLQLDWFLPNLIYANEKKYSDSPLQTKEAIEENFLISYLEINNNSEVPETNRYRISNFHGHNRIEMALASGSGTYETLQTYFKFKITIKNPKAILIGDRRVQASLNGYYVDIESPDQTSFEFLYAPYFTMTLW